METKRRVLTLCFLFLLIPLPTDILLCYIFLPGIIDVVYLLLFRNRNIEYFICKLLFYECKHI